MREPSNASFKVGHDDAMIGETPTKRNRAFVIGPKSRMPVPTMACVVQRIDVWNGCATNVLHPKKTSTCSNRRLSYGTPQEVATCTDMIVSRHGPTEGYGGHFSRPSFQEASSPSLSLHSQGVLSLKDGRPSYHTASMPLETFPHLHRF